MKQLTLSKREQAEILLAGILAILVVFLAMFLKAVPVTRYQQAEQNLEGLKDRLASLQTLKREEERELESQEAFRQRLEARPANFDFFAFVNEALKQAGLSDRAEVRTARETKPTQPMVQVQLTNITLDELVDFMHRVYASDNLVAVYEVTEIRPEKDEKGLFFELTLVTVKV